MNLLNSEIGKFDIQQFAKNMMTDALAPAADDRTTLKRNADTKKLILIKKNLILTGWPVLAPTVQDGLHL